MRGRGGLRRGEAWWSLRAAPAVIAVTVAMLAMASLSAPAIAAAPAGMPGDVPSAATSPDSTLPQPASSAWPFASAFPHTSGTGRLDHGAELWSDFVYDDYGASSPGGFNGSTFSQSSGLSPRQGDYVFPSGAADNNGADIFRAGVGLHGGKSYWRVDWVTLADPNIPIAEWTFDTDNNTSTGASQWPGQAGVTSAGIDQALIVSSRGAWLVNPKTGARMSVTSHGGSLTVDRQSKSFIVAIPNALLPVHGSWRIRLGAGLADATGQNFAAPYVDQNSSVSQQSSAERLYNITFRTVSQEPPIVTDAKTDALVAAAEASVAASPVGSSLGADGIARSITGNFWMEDDQADTLAGGDVSKFSLLLNWSQLSSATTTPAPQPTGYSTRWYVSRLNLSALGAGQRVNDGPEGDFKPTLLERVQPYAVYVPTGYHPGKALPLTWILHSLEVNYNQYGALDPQLIQQLCQSRDSICATTEGFGPAGWYYNEAETDYWQVWRSLAESFSLDPERTVISGYSMGGWASYKLAFQHPDDYAGALVLDGPLVCGVELVPGASGPAASAPACTQDGQSEPFVANARWIPYVIDQTNGDELVPTTGVEAQAQRFDSLGQRYQLLIHTGGDHLSFAVEDRFSDAVAALGHPVRTTNPGSFTFSWYPSLDNSSLGIGATGDYWLSAPSARNRSFGTIATIQAADAALPDPAITAQRFGPTPVTQPLPGTAQGLTWKLGGRPAARRQMTLKLTDVGAVTVDTAQARLPTGTLSVTTDGGTRLTLAQLPTGTEVLKGSKLLTRALDTGVASVTLPAGTTVLTLRAPAGPPRFSCFRPSGRLAGATLGPVRLGMTRTRVRRLFTRPEQLGRRYMDFFCPGQRGIRVGYPSPRLLRTLSKAQQRRVRGRAILVLSANHHYALNGIRPDTKVSKVARKLRHARHFRVGRNVWYLLAGRGGRGVLKVQRGMIQEVGTADLRLTATRRGALHFLESFY